MDHPHQSSSKTRKEFVSQTIEASEVAADVFGRRRGQMRTLIASSSSSSFYCCRLIAQTT